MLKCFLKLSPIVFTLFFSSSILATPSNSENFWKSNIVMKTVEINDARYIFQSSILLSEGHKQQMFFALFGVDKDLECSLPEIKDGVHAQVEVWKFNNRNVKILNRCSVTPDGEVFIYATAMSVDGGRYIAKQFLDSPKHVSIKNDSINLNVTAVGFSKMWHKYGGDAL